MTNQEAIDKMEFCKRAYQRMIDENLQEGVFVGKGFEGKWKADTPLYKVYEDMRDACDMSIKALTELPKRRKEAKRWRVKAHQIAGESYENGYLAGQKNIAERFEGLIKSGISTDTPDDIEYVIGLLNELSSANPQDPKYCDRNICVSNEYNGIGCDECEITKSQELKIIQEKGE